MKTSLDAKETSKAKISDYPPAPKVTLSEEEEAVIQEREEEVEDVEPVEDAEEDELEEETEEESEEKESERIEERKDEIVSDKPAPKARSGKPKASGTKRA